MHQMLRYAQHHAVRGSAQHDNYSVGQAWVGPTYLVLTRFCVNRLTMTIEKRDKKNPGINS
jgi:hypothetical protein